MPVRRLATVAVVLTAVVIVSGSVVVARGVAPMATGRAALVGCGVVHLQGHPIEDVRAALPDTPLARMVDVTEHDGAVRADVLGTAVSRAAPGGDGGCRQLAPGEQVPSVDVAPMRVTADDLVVPTSSAVEAGNAGLDTGRLGASVAAAFARRVGHGDTGATHAVVVVHEGTVVAEQYGDGVDETTPLIGWSVTSSLADAIAGRLVQRNLLAPATPVGRVWSDGDPRAAITWDHLLTMTSGLAFDDRQALGSDLTTMLFTTVDASDFAASRPLAHEPGTHWSHSSGTTNILCDAMADLAGGDRALVARRLVFEPLAMTSATLATDGDAPLCSSFAYATARDWARFGLLYEQDGVWGGQRLLPAGWVERSTTPVALPTVDPDTGERTPYGRHWWLNRGPGGGPRMSTVPLDAFWAAGDTGQHVVVVPSRHLVVVRLGTNQSAEALDQGLEQLVAGAVHAVDRSR